MQTAFIRTCFLTCVWSISWILKKCLPCICQCARYYRTIKDDLIFSYGRRWVNSNISNSLYFSFTSFFLWCFLSQWLNSAVSTPFLMSETQELPLIFFLFSSPNPIITTPYNIISFMLLTSVYFSLVTIVYSCFYEVTFCWTSLPQLLSVHPIFHIEHWYAC